MAADVRGESGLDGPIFWLEVTMVVGTDGVRGLLRGRCEPVTVVATGSLTNSAVLVIAALDVVAMIERGWSAGCRRHRAVQRDSGRQVRVERSRSRHWLTRTYRGDLGFSRTAGA